MSLSAVPEADRVRSTVSSGAEAAPGAGYNDADRFFVGRRAFHCGANLGDHSKGKRVHPLGAIQPHDSDGIRDFDNYMGLLKLKRTPLTFCVARYLEKTLANRFCAKKKKRRARRMSSRACL